MTGLTAEATAAGVGRLAWVTEQLEELVAALDEPGDHDGLRVWAAGAARRLSDHVAIWEEQLPESVLLTPAERRQAAPGHEEVVEVARAATDPHDRASALAGAIRAKLDLLDDLVAGAGPVSDGAFLRAAAVVGGDLHRLLAELETLTA